MERPRAPRAGLAALSRARDVSARRAPWRALLAAAAVLAAGCRSTRAALPQSGNGAARAADSTAAAARAVVPDTGRGNGRARATIDRSTAARFEIVGVGDTTFAFVTPRAPWVTPGAYGIVVDPRRRDALVARFTVLTHRSDTATALITGQANPLVNDHVALLARPPEPPTVLQRIERRRFWAGAAVGAVFGVIAGLLVH